MRKTLIQLLTGLAMLITSNTLLAKSSYYVEDDADNGIQIDIYKGKQHVQRYSFSRQFEGSLHAGRRLDLFINKKDGDQLKVSRYSYKKEQFVHPNNIDFKTIVKIHDKACKKSSLVMRVYEDSLIFACEQTH